MFQFSQIDKQASALVPLLSTSFLTLLVSSLSLSLSLSLRFSWQPKMKLISVEAHVKSPGVWKSILMRVR